MVDEGRIVADVTSQQLESALTEHGHRYKKVAEVRAERALQPCTVITTLSNGQTETTNFAGRGDYIVTAASGERWVVKPDAFKRRYAPKPGEQNVFIALGEVIAAPNPFGRPIEIVAPWGEKQKGEADCLIADELDPATGERAGQPYLIGRAEFEQTYRPAR